MNDRVTVSDLFISWKRELGYHKAVLLSCCYPVRMVVEMTEEEAKAEVEVINELSK